MIDINGFEMSDFHIWDKVIYEDESIELDIYYLEGGFPKMVHDSYGAAGVEEFRGIYINKIKKENHCINIWRITSDGFAINHKKNNISDFTIVYKDLILNFKKKTVLLRGVLST